MPVTVLDSWDQLMKREKILALRELGIRWREREREQANYKMTFSCIKIVR